MNATNVLFVIDTLSSGGAETSLLELTRHLDRTAFRPLVCPIYDELDLQPQFEREGIDVRPLRLTGKYAFPTAIHRLRAVIREQHVDLVHTCLFRAHQAGRIAAWLENRPAVSSFTSVAYDESRLRWNPPGSRWKHRVLQWVDALTARLVSRFHSVSETAKMANCRDLGLSLANVVVIPRGREIDRWRDVDEQAVLQRRTSLGLESAFPVLLNVGRLMPAKGQHLLIQAMPAIRNQFPNGRLLIAGAGPLHQELQTLIESLALQDVVHLLGSCSDVPILLRLADIFVFPSFYEGLPGALIEALVAGCPIAASDIPMNREVVQPELTAMLFPPDDVDALTATVCELAADASRRARMRLAALADSEARFDIRQIASETEKLYADVLRCHGNRSLNEKCAVGA